MSLKPSKYLLEEFKKECKQKCQNYKYILGTRFTIGTLWKQQKCREKCVQETIEKERPIISKNNLK